MDTISTSSICPYGTTGAACLSFCEMNHNNLWRTAIDTELRQINEYQTFREVSANELPVAGSLSSWENIKEKQ